MRDKLAARFPKVESPYMREENSDGSYVVDPDGKFVGIRDKFEWVFNDSTDVEAIEKIDGTNMAIHIGRHEHGGLYVDNVATRMGSKSMNLVEPFGPRTNHHYIARSVQNSIRRDYVQFLEDTYGTGWFFGEAVGPKFQSNPHDLDEHLFIPFDWIRDKLEYRSYGDYSTEPEEIRDWFRGSDNGLFSLFASRMHNMSLSEARPYNGTFVEGIIFVHPDYQGPIRPYNLSTDENGRANEIAKLRRDMWEGFANNDWPMTKYGHN